MLARLLYPIADPILNFDFCKGYYARFTDRLNGRVARLFVGPLLGSLPDERADPVLEGDHLHQRAER